MGLSVALMGGFAQAVGGVAAAQRQAQAKAQAEAETQMALRAQQEQIRAQAEEQQFQRDITRQKLDLERERLEFDRAPKPVAAKRAIDPEVVGAKAVKDYFIMGRDTVGKTVLINPITGEPAKQPEIQAVSDRARKAAMPAVSVAPAAPAAPAGAAVGFDAQQVAQALSSASPEAKAAIIDQLTPEQVGLVNQITRVAQAPSVASPEDRAAEAFTTASPEAQEKIAKTADGKQLFDLLERLRKRSEPKMEHGPFTPKGPITEEQRTRDAVENIRRQQMLGRISTKAADKALDAVAAKIAARSRRNAPQR